MGEIGKTQERDRERERDPSVPSLHKLSFIALIFENGICFAVAIYMNAYSIFVHIIHIQHILY